MSQSGKALYNVNTTTASVYKFHFLKQLNYKIWHLRAYINKINVQANHQHGRCIKYTGIYTLTSDR